MANGDGGNTVPRIVKAEHIGEDTGDNIGAKRVAPYYYDPATGEWNRQGVSNPPFLTKTFDEVILTYTDDTKAVLDTIVTKLDGVTQETVTYTEPTTSSERYVRS